jgi:hypothetical protein
MMGPAIKAKLADKNPNPVFDGEVEPSIPNRSENDKTVLGIDSNKNGIRDDVEIWINRTALDYNERMAMRQYARAQQERLRVCSKQSKNEISKAETNELFASYCLSAVSDYRRKKNYMSHQIWQITLSNSSRKDCPKFFDQFTYSMGGGEGDAGKLHGNCTFKIENLEEVIKKYHKLWGYVE